MKKSLIKLIIFGIAALYFCSPQNVSDIKSRTREMINRPFIQLEQQLDNFLYM